jgi:hypothetical protein
MGINLCTATDHQSFDDRPYVILDEELLEYLEMLDDFPSMQALSELDPYGLAMLDAEVLDGLRRETGQVKARAKARTLPEPPKYVGLAYGVEPCSDDEFGWEGFERFLDELDEVLTAARERNKSVLAIGD